MRPASRRHRALRARAENLRPARRGDAGAGSEIQLTDAISALLAHERVLAVRLPGRRYDCGSKLGYLQATVEYGLRHPEIGEDFVRYLKTR